MKSALDATDPSELLKRAAWDRDLAKRAAGFAEWILWDADRARLLGHAKRLEEEAAELEKQAAALAPAVTLTVGLGALPRPLEGRMERGLFVELNPQERNTLLRIANGDDRSGTHNPAHVARLEMLALIEDRGPFIDLTALGKKRGYWFGE